LHWYDGTVSGPINAPEIRFDLRESRGQSGQATLGFARPPDSAQMLDPAGNPLSGARVEGNRVHVTYNAWQLFGLQVAWGA
jgi:hypothetical protein